MSYVNKRQTNYFVHNVCCRLFIGSAFQRGIEERVQKDLTSFELTILTY